MQRSSVSVWPLISLLTTPFCVALPIFWYATPELRRTVNPEVALWYMVAGWGLVLLYSIYRAHREMNPSWEERDYEDAKSLVAAYHGGLPDDDLAEGVRQLMKHCDIDPEHPELGPSGKRVVIDPEAQCGGHASRERVELWVATEARMLTVEMGWPEAMEIYGALEGMVKAFRESLVPAEKICASGEHVWAESCLICGCARKPAEVEVRLRGAGR